MRVPHHQFQRYPPQRPPTLPVTDEISPHDLEQDQDVYGDANAMMWVCKAAIGPDGEPAECENDRGQKHGQYLQPHMDLDGESGVELERSEAQGKDGSRDYEKECYGGEDSMAEDEGVVFGKTAKPIRHS
jgi:hypothetical protein